MLAVAVALALASFFPEIPQWSDLGGSKSTGVRNNVECVVDVSADRSLRPQPSPPASGSAIDYVQPGVFPVITPSSFPIET